MSPPETAAHLLTEWNWDPTILLGTALFVGAYVGAAGPFRSRFKSTERLELGQAAWFLAGVGVIFLALVSPLDAIGDEYLFTAHMLQHMLLMIVAPPMLLLGTPGWMLRPLILRPAIRPAAKILTQPAVAFLLFNADLILWHLPGLYEAALGNEAIHAIEHLSFIATALVTWWPLLSPLPELPPLSAPWQILYLVLDSAPGMALGAFFASAGTVLYPTYAAAPHVFALHGIDDQLLGGLMMGMPVSLLFLGIVMMRRTVG